MKLKYFLILIHILLLISLIGVVQATLIEYNYGTILSSNQYGEAQNAKYAYDHNLTTVWMSPPAPGGIPPTQWIQNEYSTSKIITNYSITSRTGSANNYPINWFLLGSNDNTTFTLLDLRSGESFGILETKNYTASKLTNISAYTQYRLQVDLCEGNNYIIIGELALYNFTQAVAPVASFTTDTTSGVSPLAVQFNDTSTNTPTSWKWGRNNLTVTTWEQFSTVQNATQMFVAGNWSINLTATNAAGSNISTQVTWVNVSSGTTIPIVQWITDKTTVVFPGRIYFNDTSINTPTQWNWSFGDGTWYNTTNPSLGLNKSYQYTKRGVWIANLTVGNSAGTNTSAAKAKSIRVIGYQGFELPEHPTIWDWLNNFFVWLDQFLTCLGRTDCG
jgi:PKD repeat protein